MVTTKIVTINELEQEIQTCAREQFTGRLNLCMTNTDNQQWNLYFFKGSLSKSTSKVHPIRRWCRQVSIHCPQVSIHPVDQGSERLQYWDYNSLVKLVIQGKISPRKMIAVVEGNIREILFDIIQQVELSNDLGESLIYRRIPESNRDSKLLRIKTEPVWQQTKQTWDAWQQAGLKNLSPDLAPVIWDVEELRQQTSLLVYHNLTTLADGNRTLRDLAVKLKQQLLPLTQSIMPYLRQELMGLIEVGDLSFKRKITRTTNSGLATKIPPVIQVQTQLTTPLIVYIDDSRSDSLIMSQILAQASYRFINIRDPLKALPILLEHKPDLIFLDLVMPVVNGYEICGQIRRISLFQDTPVIILTSSDGIVDRVRAKMVGSSGFLAKPIEREKVLTALRSHLTQSREQVGSGAPE
ncbi:MAG: response regulator [Symploca sp. SIO2C1]|nr:response regulator [Symploca sp. SIO2C1]